MYTPSSRLFDIGRMLRFAAVGVLNTALGYSVILACLALGYGDIPSNITGYAAGLVLGFVLNSRWTFSGSSRISGGVVFRYALSFMLAYGANLLILLVALSFGMKGNPLVHLLGILVYSLLFYLASAHVVFRPDRKMDATENRN